MRPTVTINLTKIYENAVTVRDTLAKYGVDVTSVTKMHSGNREIVKTLVDAGIKRFGDSRIENLMNYQDLPGEKWMIRIPSISLAEETVKYSDVSLNSEYETVKALNEAAKLQNTTHDILVMMDVGDLREGYFERSNALENAVKMNALSNINIRGVAANLTCYGGVLPDENNLTDLVERKEMIEDAIGKKLEIVSGGNSTSYTLYREDHPVKGITNIRIGDTIYLGRDDTYRTHIEGMNKDSFTMTAEIIELKEKPSVPIGKRGMSALNTRPEFPDHGTRKRAILSVGKQDTDMDMFPFDEKIHILGGSSDHIIVDITDSDNDYKMGDTISFYMYYTACLRAFTSKYTVKEFVR